MLFQKRIGTGNHHVLLPGRTKRICIRPLDQVEVEQLSDLGNCQDDYEEISQSPSARKKSPLKRAVSKYLALEIKKSFLLNPEWQPPDQNFYQIPTTRRDLQEILTELLNKNLPIANSSLKENWEEWKYQIQVDAHCEKVLLEPTGRYFESIAQAEAYKARILAEIKEVKSRLENIVETETASTDDYRRRHILKGVCRKKNHRIYDADGYKVEYRDGKPFIPEMNISLKEYLQQVVEHKNARAAAKKAASDREQQEFLNERKERRLHAGQLQ